MYHDIMNMTVFESSCGMRSILHVLRNIRTVSSYDVLTLSWKTRIRSIRTVSSMVNHGYILRCNYIVNSNSNYNDFIKNINLHRTSKYSNSLYMIKTAVNFPSGSRQERLLSYPFNIDYTVI